MAPRISVILPFRNARDTLEAALRSLAGQTLREIEVLAVDDGSTDDGAGVVQDWIKRDGRFRLLSVASPSGVVAAVNTAWGSCRAGLIARMDADDISLPRRLELQWKLLESNRALAAVGCQVEVPGGDQGFHRYIDWSNALISPEDIARERFVECPVVNPTMLMRREAADAVGGHIDTCWAEDYDLWLRFLAAGYRMAKVPEVLYQWSDARPERLTRSDPRYSKIRFLRARAHYLSLLPQSSRGFCLCGAGPAGKKLAAMLRDHGKRVHCFYEVNPRRIGGLIGGVPVRSHAAMPPAAVDGPVLLSCVGAPGGRQRVRRLLVAGGYREGEDFFCCA
jgi:glycosyltransferase involved in cell wall biosynthesis